MQHNGFTTLWLLPVLAALMLLTLGLMQRQQDLRQTWYQQNMADNMASSAATILAREMNLLALINRALFANELSSAQVMGLASWFYMMKDVADRSALVSSWIPYLNTVTRNIANVVDRVEQPYMQILRGIINFQRMVTTALRATQWYARVAFALELPKTLAAVLSYHQSPNGQPISWQLLHAPGLVPVPWLWWTFIPAQQSGRDNNLAYKMMLHSLDPFSSKRSYEWFDALQIDVEKAGGARLHADAKGLWSWQSMDTVSIHVRGLLDSDEYPWGDGASYTATQISNVNANDFGASRRRNPTATEWAVFDQAHLQQRAQAFTYFNRTELAPKDWPSVIVVLPQALAKAGVFYSRPQRWFPRADGRNEQANMFNALWQSELQPLTARERTIMALRQRGSNDQA